MLDGFTSTHPPLVFQNHLRHQITDQTFGLACDIASNVHNVQTQEWSETNTPMRVFAMVYALAIERVLAGTHWKRSDRKLLEIVLLHKYQMELGPDKSICHTQRVVLGVMIQHRWTHILVDVSPSQYNRLYNMGHLKGIDVHIWQRAIVGASSVAHAILALENVSGTTLFMPTIVEDIKYGIDLLLEVHEQEGACISIKTDTGGDTRFWIEGDDPPTQEDILAQWIAIQNGVQKFRCTSNRSWKSVLLLVGKKNGDCVNTRHEVIPHHWAITLVESVYEPIQSTV